MGQSAIGQSGVGSHSRQSQSPVPVAVRGSRGQSSQSPAGRADATADWTCRLRLKTATPDPRLPTVESGAHLPCTGVNSRHGYSPSPHRSALRLPSAAPQPGFAFLAIVTLALGIGANTALFSVVRNVILKPLPYRDPERLARVWMDNHRLQMREDWASYPTIRTTSVSVRHSNRLAAFTEPTLNLISDGEPERVNGVFAEAAIFDVLGVTPIEGRLFTKDEETAGKEKSSSSAAAGASALWRRPAGRGASVIGKTLDFDGRRLTVIGIMPAGFSFPAKNERILGAPRRRRAREQPRRLLAADGCAPKTWRHAGAGAGRDGHRRQATRAAVPGRECRVRGLRESTRESRRRQRQDAALRPARRRRLRAADRVRERRRALPGAGRVPRPGDRGARRPSAPAAGI